MFHSVLVSPPDDLWRCTGQPFPVSSGLASGRIHGIALVNGALGDLIVEARWNLHWGIVGIGQRNLECTERIVIPRFWNLIAIRRTRSGGENQLMLSRAHVQRRCSEAYRQHERLVNAISELLVTDSFLAKRTYSCRCLAGSVLAQYWFHPHIKLHFSLGHSVLPWKHNKAAGCRGQWETPTRWQAAPVFSLKFADASVSGPAVFRSTCRPSSSAEAEVKSSS